MVRSSPHGANIPGLLLPRAEQEHTVRDQPSSTPLGDGPAAPAAAIPVAQGASFDPLAGLRDQRDPLPDVFVTGTVFLDIIFTGLDRAPVRGTESWARGMGSSPGGIANMATALSRLGLRTALGAAFGDDIYGDYCWESLSRDEGIDLSRSRRMPGWHSPVTVSMAYEGERTMVTHGHAAPPPEELSPHSPPRARACVTSLDPDAAKPWIAQAHAAGSLVFADIGWDETGRWDWRSLTDLRHCHAFLPNAAEAMRYTRTETPEQAARALADLVPVAVVTKGTGGAVAVDAASGETADLPAPQVEALDTTGAGDVFIAGFVTGTLAGWPLADRVAFANLTAALSVQHFGGSLSAPGWIEVAAWWQAEKARKDQDSHLLSRYAFLDSLLPCSARPWPLRRAVPTIGFRPCR